MKFTDLLKTHDVPYGWEEHENFNVVKGSPHDLELRRLAEIDSMHPTDVINSIGHSGDRAAAARLKAIYGPELENEMIYTMAKQPGWLSDILMKHMNFKGAAAAEEAAATVLPKLTSLI